VNWVGGILERYILTKYNQFYNRHVKMSQHLCLRMAPPWKNELYSDLFDYSFKYAASNSDKRRMVQL
jgi:hypothetical protein